MTMTPDEFKAALTQRMQSRRAFAAEIGYSMSAVQSWATGRQPVPVLVALYLNQREELANVYQALETAMGGSEDEREAAQ